MSDKEALIDRDALLVEMGRPDGAHNTKSPEARVYAYETLYGRYADAALKLARPMPTQQQIADVIDRSLVSNPATRDRIAAAVLDLLNSPQVTPGAAHVGCKANGRMVQP